VNLTTQQGNSSSILGLAAYPQTDAACVDAAFNSGINYFFFYNLDCESFLSGLKQILTAQGEKVLVSTGSEQRDINSLRQYLEQVRHNLNIDTIDIFFTEYISPGDDTNQVQAMLDELRYWKEKGLIRYVGATTHNRSIALELIESSACDVLMHRYNMAHRKAEEDVLPTALKANIPVVAFTCTRWGSLLKGHPQWQHKPPTAVDCYRYALNNPAISLALTAPQSLEQLAENLSGLHAPKLSPSEINYWQEYGNFIYGNGKDSFETQWL
jgi:aryl-alcohol dehydrogenase-like predicted oxidoreductase